MLRPRVIPVLLLRGDALVKTTCFKRSRYVGDPINAVRILNDKEVDELIVVDIDASRIGKEPNYSLIEQMASECFMPVCYGGGIRSLQAAERILSLGIEKICINTHAVENPQFVREAAAALGSQSVVIAIDAKKRLLGSYTVMTRSGTVDAKRRPADHAREMEALGAGELLVNSVDQDGTRKGYDLDLVRAVTSAVTTPVIALGGANGLDDLARVFREGGASAAAAGSLFVFHGKHQAVLITYPEHDEIDRLLQARTSWPASASERHGGSPSREFPGRGLEEDPGEKGADE